MIRILLALAVVFGLFIMSPERGPLTWPTAESGRISAWPPLLPAPAAESAAARGAAETAGGLAVELASEAARAVPAEAVRRIAIAPPPVPLEMPPLRR